jgi:hypothetical protein
MEITAGANNDPVWWRRWLRWYFSPRAEGQSVIGWWERRRLVYNLYLVVWDLVMVAVALPLMFLRSKSIDWMAVYGLLFVFFYVVVIIQITANLWYTGGWVVELILVWIRKNSLVFGPRALRIGTLFSFAFTACIIVGWAIAVLVHPGSGP